jgi:hypothetical protein
MYYQLPNPLTRWQREDDRRGAQQYSRERYRLAVHEGAHGLSFRFFRVPVSYIFVEGDARGECFPDYGDCTIPPWPRLVSVLAGEAADEVFFQRARDEKSDDQKQARQAARDFVGLDDLEIKRRLSRSQVVDLYDLADRVEIIGWRAALRLTRYFRTRITRLAQALDRAGRLNGDVIDDVLGKLPTIDLPELPPSPYSDDRNNSLHRISFGVLRPGRDGEGEMRGRW